MGHETFGYLKEEIRKSEDLELLADSDLAVIPISVKKVGKRKPFSIYALATFLQEKGWNMFTAKDPECMSLCLGQQHSRVGEQWLRDVREGVAHLKAHPEYKIDGDAAVYGATMDVPDEILGEVMREFC